MDSGNNLGPEMDHRYILIDDRGEYIGGFNYDPDIGNAGNWKFLIDVADTDVTVTIDYSRFGKVHRFTGVSVKKILN